MLNWFIVAYAVGFTQVQLIGPFTDKDSCEASKVQIARVSKKIEHGCVSFISPKPAQ